MFRKMRRWKQEITREECIKILEKQPRGVLAVHGEDGYPYAFPMDYIYMEGKIYFHCAKAGHKLDAIEADDRVSFCVMDDGFQKEGEWPLNINSIVIFGRISKVTDPEIGRNVILPLGMKYYPSEEAAREEVDKAFGRVQILELTIDHMTGKLVNES